jgi:uncharacterized protein (TIGR02466 family)
MAGGIDVAKTEPEIAIQHLFSAPFLSLVWKDTEDLNDQLSSLILEKRKTLPSVNMTNTGGWQSEKNFHTWDTQAVRDLMVKIDIAVFMITSDCLGEEAVTSLEEKWRAVAWANVNERNDYNNLHNHSGGVWSGVYYVDAGDDQDEHPLSGVISFRNPTLAPLTLDNTKSPKVVKKLFRSEYSITPQNSQMIIFPSWLEHQVHPYFGSRPRISVSWDVVF